MFSVLFFGTSEFAVPVLDALKFFGFQIALVITPPDKAKGRGRHIVFSPVKSYAVQHSLNSFQPRKLSAPDCVRYLTQYHFDIGIVASYGKIIPASILHVPTHGMINIHPSLLPALRGPAPIQYALLFGLTVTGVTFMLMDEGMDTGPVLFQRTMRIPARATFFMLSELLSRVAARDVPSVVTRYLTGELVSHAQGQNGVSYSKMLNKEAGQIRWENSAEKIDCMIRAFFPWPGAFTSWNGLHVKIIAAHPGSHGNLVIPCGDRTSLAIDTLQPAGKKSMSSSDFVRGYRRFLPSHAVLDRQR